MSKPKLSVVLSTYNEEKNIGDCLKSAKDIADEMKSYAEKLIRDNDDQRD